MHDTFIYSTDLKNAYIVSKKALKIYPNSIYWHEQAAKVSQWLDKRPEALEHYLFIYKKQPTVALKKKIIEYGVTYYQYEMIAPMLLEEAISNPTKENIEMIKFINDKVGNPEESALLLESLFSQNNEKIEWIEEALQIYINLGETESIQRILSLVESFDSISFNVAQDISDYYLSQNNIEKSYTILLRINKSTLGDREVKYYQKISDMGWYLQRFEPAANASKALYLLGQGRFVDTERMIAYFSDKDKALLIDVTLDGYTRFKKEYLYLMYINLLYEQKEYLKLSKALEKISGTKEGKKLEVNVNFWLMKANMYQALDEKENALVCLHKARLIEPNSAFIVESILWFFLNNHNDENLQKMIFEIEEKGNIHSDLYLPLAVGHYMLQRSDRAMVYVQKLLLLDKNNIETKMMYANLMQTRGETNGFLKIMREVYLSLRIQQRDSPTLLEDKVFLKSYLESSIYFLGVDAFKRLLEKSETILDKKDYINLSIFWALRNNAHEYARYLTTRLDTLEPWMQLSMALHEDNRIETLDILTEFYKMLPIRDRVSASIKTGNIAWAETLTFEGLENNRYDALLYKQRLDLIESNANKVDIDTGYLDRSSIVQKYFDISQRYYLEDGWYLFSSLFFAKNTNRDSKNLQNIPNSDKSFALGLQKQFDKGYMKVDMGVRDSVKAYSYFSIFTHYRPMHKVILEAGYNNSMKASDTTYLLLAGKKDQVKLKASFQYLPSSSISLSLFYQEFYDQEERFLGNGYYGRLEWYQQLHSGYPDISWGIFADFGEYSENNTSRGLIDTLQPFKGKALPESFSTVGMNFAYGTVNKTNYTRVWRPYMQFSPSYNTLFEQFNFSVGAGYGGNIYDKDHLVFGFNYNQAVNGTQESSFNLFLRYRKFF